MKRHELAELLPAGYRWEEIQGSYCARAEGLDSYLQQVGYRADAQPATRASALVGRRALEEIDSPLGVLLLRRFTHGGLLRAFTGERYRDPRRPFVELRLAHALRERGLEAPQIVGARACKEKGGGYRLDVLSLRVEGARDLESLRRACPPNLRSLAQRTGSFVRRMHEAGLYHADLTLKNLLVRGDDWIVLDLDRSELIDEPLAREARVRNLERLLRFVLRGEARGPRALAKRDYLAFLKGYEPKRFERRRLRKDLLQARHKRILWHRLGWGVERILGR